MDILTGYLGLTISIVFILYLFSKLLIIPILPLETDNVFNASEDLCVEIAVTLAIVGLLFIGSLSVITVHRLRIR